MTTTRFCSTISLHPHPRTAVLFCILWLPTSIHAVAPAGSFCAQRVLDERLARLVVKIPIQSRLVETRLPWRCLLGFKSFLLPSLWFSLSPVGDAPSTSRMLIQVLFVGSSWGGLRCPRALLPGLSSYKLLCSIRTNLQTSYSLEGVGYLFCKRIHLLEVWKIEFIHTIPMGSSKTDVLTTGDIEDQGCNPKWFVNHKHMLRPDQEGEANKLGYFILKVPEYWRQPSIAFSPQGWQFGLHNRENLDSSGSEAIKLAIAVQYGLVGEKWDHFCDAIVDDPKAMLACYGLQKGVTSWTDEEIKHVLALDALFLVDLFDTSLSDNEGWFGTHNALPSKINPDDAFYARYNMWADILPVDFCRVENQIPFFLIDKVVEYIRNSIASPTSKSNEPFIGDLQYQQKSVEFVVNELANYFMPTSSEAFKIDNASPLGEKTHILGIAYKVICGSKGLLMKRMWGSAYIHILSATKLDQSGIKIVGVDGPLCTMSYKKKCLCLPKLKIYDGTISFIRNMAWYESKNISEGCLFYDYIALMCDLIQAPEDLHLLIKGGVIDNACGIKAFGMWKALDEGLAVIPSSEIHHNMKKAIMSRCDRRRYRLWSEFKIVFCSKPWLVLSTIAIVLVTMATLVQTYISVIGSNKMKPKFP